MNIQRRYSPSLIAALVAGFAAILGIFHYYQSISSQPVFPIDKSTLTITRIDRPGNSGV